MALTSDSPGSPEQHHNHSTTGPLPTGAEASAATSVGSDVPQSRRARREAEQAATGPTPVIRAAVTAGSPASARAAAAAPAVARASTPITASSAIVPRAAVATPVKIAPTEHRGPRIKRPTKRNIVSTIVMTAAAGLIATMALPAYAFSTSGAFDPAASTSSLANGQQTLNVDASAIDAKVSRDDYQAPTKDDLAAAEAKAAAAAAAAAALQVATVSSTTSSSGVSNTLGAVNPPSGPYSGEAVVAYAMQFVGKVPYGAGASPDTSFGCDGLTQYVFKQFGINIPRTVSNQAAAGTRISAADAQPGDLMIFPIGHVGIYAGNGMMIDSPDWGRYVEYRPQWGSFYYVRLGI